MPVLNVEKLIENRVEAIRKYHEETGLQRAELDVSGGVDSAVVLGLLAKAVGPENITAVYSGINSSESSLLRARAAAQAFGVSLIELQLSSWFEVLTTKMALALEDAGYALTEVYERCRKDPTIEGSIRSCIRAPIGRGLNRATGGGIRHGTGNECEDRWLRFYQKGGDGEVDTNPIAMLSKGEVYQLAIGLGVPDAILTAVPSPDLHGNGELGHNDEDELKALTGVEWTYSRVVLHDVPHAGLRRGDYSYVGTIERMSRWMDARDVWYNKKRAATLEGTLNINDYDGHKKLFPQHNDYQFRRLLASAMYIERTTRHKHNPNIPTLGARFELLDAGILTDELPEF